MPLPKGSNKVMEKASQQPTLQDPKKIGHKLTKETLDSMKIGSDGLLTRVEIGCFKEMLSTHGKAFSFEPHEIGCVDPKVVAPMVIFTVPHMPWNLRPIPVPKAHISKLIDLLNEKICMGILKPSLNPYIKQMVYCSQKEWLFEVYSRFVANQQGNNTECWHWSNC